MAKRITENARAPKRTQEINAIQMREFLKVNLHRGRGFTCSSLIFSINLVELSMV
jgi:hypothetical protein